MHHRYARVCYQSRYYLRLWEKLLCANVTPLCHIDPRGTVEIAGIDPGITGAVAFVNVVSKAVHIEDLPLTDLGKRRTIDPYTLGDIIAARQVRHVRIENVATRPGQGVSSSGNFMFGAGILWGVLGGLGIKSSHIVPAKWKRDLGLLGMGKDGSLALARRLFPMCATVLKRKKDADRAEALLIAHHYIITHGGYGTKPCGYAAASRLKSKAPVLQPPVSSKSYPRPIVLVPGSLSPVRRRSVVPTAH